jgi:hypothetical protein
MPPFQFPAYSQPPRDDPPHSQASVNTFLISSKP